MVPAYVRVWSLVMKSLAVAPLAPLSVLAETMSIVAVLLLTRFSPMLTWLLASYTAGAVAGLV